MSDEVDNPAGDGGILEVVSSGGDPGAPEPSESPLVPASAVLGDDGDNGGEDPTGAAISKEINRIKGNQPKTTVTAIPKRDSTGKFVKPVGKPAAAPAKPAVPPAPEPVKPAAAPVPAKIKVGGKEYTEEELTAILNKPAAPAAAPEAPKPPEQPAGPTPEETKAAEDKFVSDMVSKLPVSVDEALLEKVILGGKEGAEALTTVLRQSVARAVLETRRSVYDDLNPVIGRIMSQLEPVVGQQQQLEQHATETAFIQAFPEFKDDIETPRSVAQTLLERYPQQVAQMGRDGFIREVARQTDLIKEREFQRWKPAGFTGTWKDYAAAQKTPPAPAVPAPEPGKPAAPPKPKVQPPSANTPSSSGAPSDSSFSKRTAATLLD